MNQLLYLGLGLMTGVFGGLFGIGGSTVLIPALIFFCGLTQHQAQGTTLALMVLPIGLLAALRYFQGGNVKLEMVLLLALGWLIGGFLGASLAHQISDPLLKKLFGVFLLIVSLRMIFAK
jgi:uncharacterized membrane protein YfcA